MSVSTLTMAAGRDRSRALSADVRGDARSRARRGVAGADGRDAHPVPRADDPGDPRRAEPAARSSPAPRPTQSPHCSAQLATDCCCTHYSTPSSTWPPRLTRSAPCSLRGRTSAPGRAATHRRGGPDRALPPLRQAWPCFPRLSLLPCVARALPCTRIQNALIWRPRTLCRWRLLHVPIGGSRLH